jgi:8-oxo-dGTP pyrophosphatase MutT (NUDIX family)
VNLLADAITVLSDWSAPDAGQETLRRRYLRHLRDHADAMSRHCVPGHVTASSLIVSGDQARVLLTLHARLGRWLQTGGHCEEDLHLAAAALREATEESGIPTLLIDPVPVLLSAHSEACGTVAARYALRRAVPLPGTGRRDRHPQRGVAGAGLVRRR